MDVVWLPTRMLLALQCGDDEIANLSFKALFNSSVAPTQKERQGKVGKKAFTLKSV